MTRPALLPRETLQAGVIRPLSRGGWGNPDVLLVRWCGAMVVVKDFAPRAAWVRHTLGRWITSRELRAYAALEGIPEVPCILGQIDALAFVLEYRPGEVLGRSLAGRVPADFTQRLEQAIAEMHMRGVVHLDLRHRSNVLASPDGRPIMLDFASAICFRPGGFAARWLLPALAWFDRRALLKWQVRLASPQSGTISEGSRGESRET